MTTSATRRILHITTDYLTDLKEKQFGNALSANAYFHNSLKGTDWGAKDIYGDVQEFAAWDSLVRFDKIYLGGDGGNIITVATNATGDEDPSVATTRALNSINIGRGAGISMLDNSGHINIGQFAGRNSGGGSSAYGQNINMGYYTGDGAHGAFLINLGSDAGYSQSGDHNTNMGANAGYLMSGSHNNLFGYSVGTGLYGDNNDIIGGHSTGNGLSGDHNSIMGTNAGVNSHIGNAILLGHNAGAYTDAVSGAISIGFGAGVYTSGVNNVMIGTDVAPYLSGNNNFVGGHGAAYKLSGDRNVAFGEDVAALTSGSGNILIGESNAYKLSGDSNISIGNFTSESLEGSRNINIGINAGGNTTGNDCIYIGQFAGSANNIDDALEIRNTTSAILSGDFSTGNITMWGKFGIGDAPFYDFNITKNANEETRTWLWNPHSGDIAIVRNVCVGDGNRAVQMGVASTTFDSNIYWQGKAFLDTNSDGMVIGSSTAGSSIDFYIDEYEPTDRKMSISTSAISFHQPMSATQLEVVSSMTGYLNLVITSGGGEIKIYDPGA